MELLELLRVDRDRLPRRSERAVQYIQRRWVELGKPTDGKGLTDFLDQALRFCTQQELVYPRAFLLRLKQLQRAEWSPPATFDTS